MHIPFFSIIVPVYNVEQYLNTCIRSILQQDFTNFELFLLDDGSSDSSGKICDYFANKDNRITVFHSHNVGLSATRNTGISKSKGEYLWFIDSDDWLISTSALSTISKRIYEKKPDVIVYSFKEYYQATNTFSKSFFKNIPEDLPIKVYLQDNIYKACSWNKIVKHSLIDEYSLRFPVGRNEEDIKWCADLLALTSSITICTTDLLAYRQRSNSITSNRSNESRRKNAADGLFIIKSTIDEYRLSDTRLEENDLIGSYLAYEFSWLLGTLAPFWNEYKKEIKEVSFILDYKLSRKANKVSHISRIFGLRITSYILFFYIFLKSRLHK